MDLGVPWFINHNLGDAGLISTSKMQPNFWLRANKPEKTIHCQSLSYCCAYNNIKHNITRSGYQVP